MFDILVPSNLPELMAELSKRPAMRNRNWFPVGHPLAAAAGEPTGQSVSDLAAEFAYESAREEQERGKSLWLGLPLLPQLTVTR